MFAKACTTVRQSLYAIMGVSQLNPTTVNASTGTAFMIAPGYLVTAAHLVHVQGNPAQARHQRLEVIRAPDIGSAMVDASFVAEDVERDIALLQLNDTPKIKPVKLLRERLPVGTPCGSLGFPLGSVEFLPQSRALHILERFQGASVSSYHMTTSKAGRELPFYETDSLMYKGSSGCPGFDRKGRCFGMHVKSAFERVQAGGTGPLPGGETRLAISMWVPSTDIVSFLEANSLTV